MHEDEQGMVRDKVFQGQEVFLLQMDQAWVRQELVWVSVLLEVASLVGRIQVRTWNQIQVQTQGHSWKDVRVKGMDYYEMETKNGMVLGSQLSCLL